MPVPPGAGTGEGAPSPGGGGGPTFNPIASPPSAATPAGNASTGGSSLGEIIPAASALAGSMRVLQVTPIAADAKPSGSVASVAQTACLPVTFRPDTQRRETTLVDLTGDGLIVSAVSNAHVQTVIFSAGYKEINLAQPARWCLSQAATRDLLQPHGNAATQHASRLVQVGSNWQLMSQDQWLAHQAAMRPAATEPTTASAAATAANTRASKASTSANAKTSRTARSSSITTLVQRLGNKLSATSNTAKQPSVQIVQK